ncbi:MAG: flagellin [Candidatus Methanoperedens sp.]|nr:flagellin [Candidatus Methanoperedens sp.]
MIKSKNNILKNNTGDVGIGTLIIFIAMVLVAAVAAAVLIQTSGVLQQKAQITGKQATAEVASNLKVVSIVGNTLTIGANIDNFTVTVQTAPGGSDIDFSKVIIKYIDSTKTDTLNYTKTVSPDPTNFRINDTTGVDNQVLSPGEIGVIRITPTNSLATRGKATIEIIPETGTMVIQNVVAPATFKSDFVQLFP